MKLPEDFILESFHPPAIISIGGKTYACPGWHEIHEDTSIEELLSRWKKSFRGLKSKAAKEVRILSSDGKREYIVSLKGNEWSCNCVGFKYHRRCKHIDKVSNSK